MNFYVLVEGAYDESRVYAEWLKQAFPFMSQVKDYQEVARDQFVVVAGGGQPRVTQLIVNSMQEIVKHGNFDRFFVCLDAENLSYEERFRRTRFAVDEAMNATRVRELIPHFREHIIIQNVCIETWFLGNVPVVNAVSNHEAVKPLKDHYDVTSLDPEKMPHDPKFKVRAQFHKHYLKQVLHANRRKFPGIAKDPEYNRALRNRCAETNHLRSLQRFFDVLANP
jgi:5'(3')-deoxyribonucleotidase